MNDTILSIYVDHNYIAFNFFNTVRQVVGQLNYQELEKVLFLAFKEVDRLRKYNGVLVEALKDILSGTPAMDRAEKTLKYLSVQKKQLQAIQNGHTKQEETLQL